MTSISKEENNLKIRKAALSELAAVMQVIDKARLQMRRDGNATQWSNDYPQLQLMAEEITRGHCYIALYEDRIVATFCLVEGPDPTYTSIEGAWLNDAPYHVIHRMASDGSLRGVGSRCIEWCRRQCGTDLRIDTHADNHRMQWVVARAGFTRCGIIYVSDGSPRLAYQLTQA